MKNNKKPLITPFWLIMYLLCGILLVLLFSGSFKDGINTVNTNKDGVTTYKSLADAQKVLDIELPETLDVSDIKEVRSIMGRLTEILSGDYVLKISPFVNVNADPLGLYEKPEVRELYNIKGSDITFIKYRTGYPGYENCTLFNWCTSSTSYGMMHNETLSLDECLDFIGVDKDKLSVYTEENQSDAEELREQSTIDWEFYSFGMNEELSIELPKLESEIETLNFDGYTIFFLNKTRFMVVLYNDYVIDQDLFKGQGDIKVNDSLSLRYLIQNEFQQETQEYNDYNVILNNINAIAKSIDNQ